MDKMMGRVMDKEVELDDDEPVDFHGTMKDWFGSDE